MLFNVSDLGTTERDSLLQLDHLCHNMLNRGRAIESMWVPEVNRLNTEPFEALLAGNRNICGVAAEPKTCGQLDGPELGSKEDVLALLGVLRNPLADYNFTITLHARLDISNGFP